MISADLSAEQSERNFLMDIWGRTSPASGWFVYGGPEVQEKARRAVDESPSWKSFHQSLYKKAEASLRSQLHMLKRDGGEVPVESLVYDARYGWVANAGQDECYPGKTVLWENTRLLMGRQSYISGESLFRGGHSCQIGCFCSIGEGLFVETAGGRHPMVTPSTYNFRIQPRDVEERFQFPVAYPELSGAGKGVDIGHDVWIGRNVSIQPGSVIGNGCVIGQGSLVRGTLEPYGIYAGTPAKLKRFRFPEGVRNELNDLGWWWWSPDKIKEHRDFFSFDLSTVEQFPNHLLRK